MASVGTISVGIAADTGNLFAGLQRSRAQISSFVGGAKSTLAGIGSSAVGAGRGLMSIGGSIAGVAGAVPGLNVAVAALSGMAVAGMSVANAMDAIDKAADFSQTIGASVQEVRRLQFAAEMSGGSAELMEDSLQKMVRTLGAARAGSTEAEQAFTDLGLSTGDLVNKSPSEALGIIADRINTLPSYADKATASMAIFGRAGMDLLPTLANGSDGLATMADRFDEIGGVITEEDAALMGEAKDAIDQLKVAFSRLGNEMAITVVPVVKKVAEWITMLVVAWNNLRKLFGLGVKLDTASSISQAPELGKGQLEARERAAAKEAEKAAMEADKRQNELANRAKSIWEQVKSPTEQYAEKVNELNELVLAGALSWDIYGRAVKRSQEDLLRAEGRDRLAKAATPQSNTAVLRGSTEAFSAITQARSVQQQQNDRDKQRLELEKQNAAYLQKIVENTGTKILVREQRL